MTKAKNTRSLFNDIGEETIPSFNTPMKIYHPREAAKYNGICKTHNWDNNDNLFKVFRDVWIILLEIRPRG